MHLYNFFGRLHDFRQHTLHKVVIKREFISEKVIALSRVFSNPENSVFIDLCIIGHQTIKVNK